MLFGRNIYNAIDASGSMPVNIAHSVYVGTEQTITASLFDGLSLKMSYQYNKSFDLSSGKTFEDNVEVPYIRNHTIKGSVTYTGKAYDLTLDGTYASATKDSYGATWDDYLVINLVTNVHLSETLTTYLAIDNVLNASYELSAGYPMPGTKIRLGGKLRF
jgi:vitamin B12 transporter